MNKIFILGIGGTFMGNIAQFAKSLGKDVYGVDSKLYPPMSNILRDFKINFREGYNLENFIDADEYIIGNVVSRDNKLYQKIVREKKKIISGPRWLYENILKDKTVIAISGTHGKTTVTNLVSYALEQLRLEPSYLIAGAPKEIPSSLLQDGNLFVLEADEYDTSCFDKGSKFFHYKPDVLLVNNIEFDHADIFDNIDEIESNFFKLISGLPQKSVVLLNRNGIRESFLNLLSLNASTQSKIKIFSVNESNLIQENISSATEVLKEFIDSKSIQKIFKKLPSVRRRFEYVYTSNSLDVIDDFAHHPTAISKTLKLAQQRYQDLVLVLEIGSNSMKSGIHDVRLLEIFKDTKTLLVNASKAQISKFNKTTEKATLEKLIKICGKKTKKKRAILFCGNKDFNRLQENLINHLISDST